MEGSIIRKNGLKILSEKGGEKLKNSYNAHEIELLIKWKTQHHTLNLLYKLNRIYCVYYENAKTVMLLMYHALSGIYARFLYAAVHCT